MPAMTDGVNWIDLRGRRMAEPGAESAYQGARLAFDVGVSVRALREQRGLRQSQLARSSGLTQSVVARVEAGGAAPTLAILDRLARVLDAELVVRFDPNP